MVNATAAVSAEGRVKQGLSFMYLSPKKVKTEKINDELAETETLLINSLRARYFLLSNKFSRFICELRNLKPRPF